jgi:hypothetical protein
MIILKNLLVVLTTRRHRYMSFDDPFRKRKANKGPFGILKVHLKMSIS